MIFTQQEKKSIAIVTSVAAGNVRYAATQVYVAGLYIYDILRAKVPFAKKPSPVVKTKRKHRRTRPVEEAQASAKVESALSKIDLSASEPAPAPDSHVAVGDSVPGQGHWDGIEKTGYGRLLHGDAK